MRCSFGVDLNRSHEELVAESIRLAYMVRNAPTVAARRKAAAQLRRFNDHLRRGGAVGGGVVERSNAAIGANYETAWEEARAAGRAARNREHTGFPQGWATLVTSDRTFAKILVRLGPPDLLATDESLRKQRYLGGYGFGVQTRTHSLAEGEAFCNAAVDVLKRYGINVWCHTAWD
jgi:hypothetical protein